MGTDPRYGGGASGRSGKDDARVGEDSSALAEGQAAQIIAASPRVTYSSAAHVL